jgi:hypothetical protein
MIDMTWFFRGFFGLIGLCLVLWLLGALKNALSPKREDLAVVQGRRRERFPLSTAGVRKDREEYLLTFFLPECGRTVTLRVSDRVYAQCQTGLGGTLRRRGDRFLSFQTRNGLIDPTGLVRFAP